MARWRQKKWRVIEEDRDAAELLAKELGCSPLAARLLVNRGYASPNEAVAFLNADFSHLPDPFLLPDAEAAAERIKQALHRQEKISVHGDYDGDGVTSAALWTRLRASVGHPALCEIGRAHV